MEHMQYKSLIPLDFYMLKSKAIKNKLKKLEKLWLKNQICINYSPINDLFITSAHANPR
jgi:hypothetical protein